MIAAIYARKSTEQTTRNALVCVSLLLCLAACRQGEAPKQDPPVLTAAQRREDLGETLIDWNAPDLSRLTDAWNRKKDALKSREKGGA